MPKTTNMKTLNNTSVADAKQNVPDIQVTGNGDTFQLLCKASSKSQKWMKSCKAMEIPGAGCIVQVTTQQGDHVAEALTFVPGVKIADDVDGGRKLVLVLFNPEPVVSEPAPAPEPTPLPEPEAPLPG